MSGGTSSDFARLGYTWEDLIPIGCALGLLLIVMLAGPRLPSELRREATVALLVPLFGYPAMVRLGVRLRLPQLAMDLVRLAGVALAFCVAMWRWSLELGARLSSLGWEPELAELPWVTWSSAAFFAAVVLWLMASRQREVLAMGRFAVSVALSFGCLLRVAIPVPSFPSWLCLVAASTTIAAWSSPGRVTIAIAASAVSVATVVSGHDTIVTAGTGIMIGGVGGVLARLLHHSNGAA